MSPGPDFRELVGEDGASAELESLRHVHDLLVGASPPPPLPRRLAEPPRVRRRPLRLRVRIQTAAALAAAAAAVAVGFGIGHAVGAGSRFEASATRPMHGVGQLASASARIEIGKPDANGNRPLRMTVRGLATLPRGGWYELLLTNEGERDVSCGTFTTVGAGAARIVLNSPYELEGGDGWIVTAHVPGEPDRVLLTT